MAGSLSAQIRLEQTYSKLDSLRAQFEEWLKYRREADKLRQYHSQFNSLEEVLNASLSRLRTRLDGVSYDLPVGEIYRTCREYDEHLTWVLRIWNYFRNKFDQRDDQRLSLTLAAADEVVWSCYMGAFAADGGGGKRGVVPLPYVEALYAPQAVTRDEPPSDLKAPQNASPQFVQNLEAFLKQLPIPVIGLPRSCIDAPWWLSYLAHEVGHHIQHDLGLIDYFGTLLKTTAQDRQDETRAKRWYFWGQEIFADLFSVCTLGPWAVWAMTELERTDPKGMLKSKINYPSPVVRLGLMAQAAAHLLGATEHPALTGMLPDERILEVSQFDPGLETEQAIADLRLVQDMIVAALTDPLQDFGPFELLGNWTPPEFQSEGGVDSLAAELFEQSQVSPQPTLNGARLLISASVGAWARVTSLTDSHERHERRDYLARIVPPLIAQSRQEGMRDDKTTQSTETETLGGELARLLLENSSEG
jgi:hypothetical protein